MPPRDLAGRRRRRTRWWTRCLPARGVPARLGGGGEMEHRSRGCVGVILCGFLFLSSAGAGVLLDERRTTAPTADPDYPQASAGVLNLTRLRKVDNAILACRDKQRIVCVYLGGSDITARGLRQL